MLKKVFLLIPVCVALLSFSAARAEELCSESAPLIVYPAPQEACISATAQLPANLTYNAKAKTFTKKNLSRFTSIFSKAGTALVKGDAESANVIFVKSDAIRTGAFRDEGYKIEIKAEPFSIKIAANSETGFLYAASTLKDLIINKSGRAMIYTGRIDDYPKFMFRGVLDGGYDIWEFPNRLDIIKWMPSVKFNFFIYAPKEDPYFRRQWRVPYPPEIISQFKSYIKAAKDENIIFSFSLSPALSMEYSNPKDFETLVKKYRQIQALGVDNFGIFFDDVLPFLGTPADRKKFANIAEAEVYVSNKLLRALREKDPNAKLFFVPNQYWGWTPTVYMDVLKNKLNPEIEVGWTGELIVSDKIDVPDSLRFKEVAGRMPSIGDNFSPLGPLVNRSPDLYKAAQSFVNNPYNFAGDGNGQYSKFVNATIGDYTWNPEAYSPERSMIMAASRLAGGNAEGELLLLAMKMTHRATYESGMRKTLKADIDKLAASSDGGATQAASSLKAEFEKLSADMQALKGRLEPELFAKQMAESFDKAAAKFAKAIAEIDSAAPGETGAQLADKIRKALGI